jgi:hypothetical protein
MECLAAGRAVVATDVGDVGSFVVVWLGMLALTPLLPHP